MKKIILTAILAGSAAFAFAGNVSVNLGGIGVSVGDGRHGTNVGVSIGSPYYCYPPVVVTPQPAPPPPVWVPPVYYYPRPAFRPAPPPQPRHFRHDGPPRRRNPGGPGKGPGPRR